MSVDLIPFDVMVKQVIKEHHMNREDAEEYVYDMASDFYWQGRMEQKKREAKGEPEPEPDF